MPTYGTDTQAATGGGGALSQDLSVIPLSLATDDLLIAIAGWRAQYSDIAVSGSGWTEPEDLNQANGPSASLFYKAVAGGDPSIYTFSVSGTASRVVVGGIQIPGPGIVVEAIDAQQGNSTTPTAPALTSEGEGRLCLRWFVWTHVDTLSDWPPAGHTDELAVTSGGAAAGHITLGVVSKEVGAGSVGTANVTLGLARNWVAGTIILADPVGGGPSSPLRRWDGVEFVAGGALKRWDGTTFVDGGTIRRWTGTGWEPVP